MAPAAWATSGIHSLHAMRPSCIRVLDPNMESFARTSGWGADETAMVTWPFAKRLRRLG